MSVVFLKHPQLRTINKLVAKHGHARRIAVIDDPSVTGGIILQLSCHRAENLRWLIKEDGSLDFGIKI